MKKMPTLKQRDHEDVSHNHVKDDPQPKRLRTKPKEALDDPQPKRLRKKPAEQKEALDDPQPKRLRKKPAEQKKPLDDPQPKRLRKKPVEKKELLEDPQPKCLRKKPAEQKEPLDDPQLKRSRKKPAERKEPLDDPQPKCLRNKPVEQKEALDDPQPKRLRKKPKEALDDPQAKRLQKKPAEQKEALDDPRPIRLWKKPAEQKEPLDDPIVETLCHQRLISIKQTGNLSNVPYELLLEIAKRLKKLEDFTCFRCVSRSLHRAVEGEYFEGLRLRKSLPYLMLRPVSSRDGIRQFYSLVEGESIVASMEVPTFTTMTKMCFESLGWLLTVAITGSMSLLDPFSNTEIHVPHLDTFPGIRGHRLCRCSLVMKMVLSSRPKETSDFILMVIIGDCSHLAFWRLGDAAWNKIHEPKLRFNDVVYGGSEQFYAINSCGTIWVINLAAGRVESRIIIDRVPGLFVDLCQGQYILKSIDGSLLGITRTRDKKSFLTTVFQVYDIDIETGKWKEIHSIGCMAIFLGRNSSIAVDATAPSNGGVIRANHIYFTDDYGDYQNAYTSDGRRVYVYGGNSRYEKGGSVDSGVFYVDSGVFDFETGAIEPIYPVELLSDSDVCPAMWITPNLSF